MTALVTSICRHSSEVGPQTGSTEHPVAIRAANVSLPSPPLGSGAGGGLMKRSEDGVIGDAKQP